MTPAFHAPKECAPNKSPDSTSRSDRLPSGVHGVTSKNNQTTPWTTMLLAGGKSTCSSSWLTVLRIQSPFASILPLLYGFDVSRHRDLTHGVGSSAPREVRGDQRWNLASALASIRRERPCVTNSLRSSSIRTTQYSAAPSTGPSPRGMPPQHVSSDMRRRISSANRPGCSYQSAIRTSFADCLRAFAGVAWLSTSKRSACGETDL